MKPNVADYLRNLSRLCLEVAATPALLPVFLRIVAMVPATVTELRREAPVSPATKNFFPESRQFSNLTAQVSGRTDEVKQSSRFPLIPKDRGIRGIGRQFRVQDNWWAWRKKWAATLT
jgi:hypothetical protein